MGPSCHPAHRRLKMQSMAIRGVVAGTAAVAASMLLSSRQRAVPTAIVEDVWRIQHQRLKRLGFNLTVQSRPNGTYVATYENRAGIRYVAGDRDFDEARRKAARRAME